MLRLAVLVSGGGTNLQAIIDAVTGGYLEHTSIALVFSNNKNAYALERAKNAGIPTLAISPSDFESREEFEDAMLHALEEVNPDIIVLAGFLVKIPRKMVEVFEHKIINIHPSLIPSFCGRGYYGLKVHEAALKRGVKLTGATVHFVDEDMDTGPILLQKAVEVKDGDTAKSLQERVMKEAEWIILPEAIKMLEKERA